MEPRTQKELLEKYPGTLICFMLNIPGPEKVNELFEKVFYEGLEKIQNKLETEKISTEVRLVQENITGYEGYLVVKAGEKAYDCFGRDEDRETV